MYLFVLESWFENTEFIFSEALNIIIYVKLEQVTSFHFIIINIHLRFDTP